MQRPLTTRRRPRYGAQLCAVMAALLLLLSVSVLYTRLSSSSNPQSHPHPLSTLDSIFDDLDIASPLLDDVETDTLALQNNNQNQDDLIDEGDVLEEDGSNSRVSDEEEILRGLEDDSSSELSELGFGGRGRGGGSGYFYWDHVVGARRRAFDKQLIDPWEEDNGGFLGLGLEDKSRVAVASDDQPVNEDVRVKFDGIKGIEDALLLKTGKGKSALREGWANWFEKKGDFLRRDKMFRSNLELLNPMNNPLLQDPDGIGSTVLTRGDKLMQKALLSEIHKAAKGESGGLVRVEEVAVRSRDEGKSVGGRTLNDNASVDVSFSDPSIITRTVGVDDGSHGNALKEQSVSNDKRQVVVETDAKNLEVEAQIKSEVSDYKYADGKRWGYFPGLYAHLSFSEFMDEFFKKGKCSMRVFMVWNSAPWMYTVRLQRGLESLLYHHPDACVVVFSETIELDFFKDFVKDGYKVSVAMPNLDELLSNTPTHIFASVWFEWRKTNHYPLHYSELIRLAALYKYGGLYLDTDIIVLKPLSSLNNSIGMEGKPDQDQDIQNSSINGAVMKFSPNNSFIMECLKDFYSTYDDKLLRWNGADLVTRTLNKNTHNSLDIQPSFAFFPISPRDITRYFTVASDEEERAHQHVLLLKILDGSYTFHFWNSITSNIIPEPGSLVERLLNHHCIRCHDVL